MILIVRRVAIALSLALAALLLWFRRVDPPKFTRLTMATVPVVVAARDMPGGVVIDRTSLVVARWPAGTQPAGAYGSIDSVAGRVSRVAVYKGEAMVPGRLAPGGTDPGLEVKITPGKRAYGIRINDAGSLAGMVQPNSRVDIMVVIDDPESSKQVAKVFMSNMRVLAIGAAPERAPDGRPIDVAVASIEVTAVQSEQLAIAAAQGALQLLLRGYGDHEAEARGAPDSTAVGRRRDPLPIQRGTFGCQRDSGLVRDLLLRSCSTQQFIRDSTGTTEPALNVRRPES